jgi:hypothetical protein
MLAAIFALDLAGLGTVRERRWTALRILLRVEGITLFVILVAGVRAHDEFDSANVVTWVFVVGFGATDLATAALHVRMQARSRRHCLSCYSG